MFVILGCIVVIASVLGGFSMAGGHVGALIHPSEFVTIGGASFGGMIIMAPKSVLIDLFKGVLHCIKGSPFNRDTYLDVFRLFYALSRTMRRDGLLALETHVTSPAESAIFQKFPKILANHHLTHFLTNTLSLLFEGSTDVKQIEEQMEAEIHVVEHEHHAASGLLAKTADALPGFGIVAAVLGIVITMGAINGPAEEIGHKVGAALVGTFLGILLSYGFFGPLAARMDSLGAEEVAFLRCVAQMSLRMFEGASPREVITRTWHGVGSEMRPSREQMDAMMAESET